MPDGLPEPMQLPRRPVAASFDEDAQWALEKFQPSRTYLYNQGFGGIADRRETDP